MNTIDAEGTAPFPFGLAFTGGLCLVSVATLVIAILIYVKVSKQSAAQQPGQYSPMPQQPVQYPPQPGQQPPHDQQQAAPQPPPAQPPTDPQQP